MSNHRVSIIIPVYNVEAYLRECLNSVIAQTYRNWECIIVDDASTDLSVTIAGEFCDADARFRLVRHSVNCGQAAARNTGLDAATGRKIVFIDSDDAVHPSMLEVGLQSDADIVCFDFEKSWKRFSRLSQEEFRSGRFAMLTSREAQLELLYQTGRMNASVWSKMFDADLFRDVRFISGLTYEDLEIVSRLFTAARSVADSPLKLYFYRQTPGSFIHTWSRRRLDVLTVTEEIERRMSYDDELLKAARDRRFAANFNMLLLMCRNGMGASAEANACRGQLRRLRRQVMFNSRSRLKNKAGAVVAYLARF